MRQSDPVWFSSRSAAGATPAASFRRARSALYALFAAALACIAHAEVALTWSDNSDNEDGFTIERSENGGAFVEIGQTAANVATYTDTTVVAGMNYDYRVNAYNAYGESGYTNVAGYYLNVAPTISPLSSVSLEENGTSGPVAFTISDFETDASALLLSVVSSNPDLIDASGVSFGGSGAERTLTLSPKTNVSGTATLTVTVSDGEDSASRSLALTVDSFVFPTLSLAIDTFAETARAGEVFGISAVASDESLVSSVAFSIDGVVASTDSAAPFEADLNVASEGSVTVRAVASIVGRSETVVAETVVVVGRAPLSEAVVSLLRAASIDGASTNGSANYDLKSDTITLSDDIGQIGGATDTHRYHYVRADGDVDLSARLTDLQSSSDATRAGLMLRSALYGKASQVSLLADRQGRIYLTSRSARGEAASTRLVAEASEAIDRLRLVRTGGTVIAYGSAAGGAWSELGQAQVDLGSQPFAGFALAASLPSGSATAQFDLIEVVASLIEWNSGATPPSVPTGLIITAN